MKVKVLENNWGGYHPHNLCGLLVPGDVIEIDRVGDGVVFYYIDGHKEQMLPLEDVELLDVPAKHYCVVYGTMQGGVTGVVGPFCSESETNAWLCENRLDTDYEVAIYAMDSPG